MNKLNLIKNIINKYSNKPKEIIEIKKIKTKLSGRIISKRQMRLNTFMNLQDIYGNIQILINKKFIKKKKYLIITKKIRLGDIVKVKGHLYKTNTNELTVKCKYIKILTKTKIPLTNKFYKPKNLEKRFRQRYLDLILNKNTQKIFLTRIKIINQIKKYLNKKNFLEVETPILHSIPGGASAKPFSTYHNKLKKKIYLRIAPELYLKQLIIGGFTKIFELNKNFRNEGISKQHNPEFTMIEIYKAYSNYKYMMKLIEKIFFYVIKSISFNDITLNFKNKKINFNSPYKKITIYKSIYKYTNYFNNLKEVYDINKIKKVAKKLKIKTKNTTKGKIISKIFKKTTEKYLIQPTFITEYPTDISPLAKSKKNNKKITERFELFIGGYEIANGFSELNNYKEQKKRFKKQLKYNKKYKIFYNKEYLNALKYGLPPTSGIGIGIDRLTMLLTNTTSIKEVILFNTFKNKNIK